MMTALMEVDELIAREVVRRAPEAEAKYRICFPDARGLLHLLTVHHGPYSIRLYALSVGQSSVESRTGMLISTDSKQPLYWNQIL